MWKKLSQTMSHILGASAAGSVRDQRRPRQFRPGLESLEERAVMSVTSEFHVNTRTPLDQENVAVASQRARNGRSVVVWQHQFSRSSNETDIKAQIYDSSGRRVGGEITVAASIFSEREPSVAMDAQGNFVIVWTAHVNSSADTDILAQRYFANGARNGGTIVVAADVRQEHSSDVAMDGAGNFVVSYSLVSSPGSGSVMARRFASNGAALGSSFVVASSVLNAHSSSVARTADGRFAIAYEVQRPVPGGRVDTDVRLNRYSATGGLMGIHDIANSPKSEFGADVAMDSAGNSVVVYQLAFAGVDHDIMARKVFFNGSALGPTMVVDAGTDFEFAPTVAMDQSDGDFVVAYNRLRNNGGTLAGPNNLIVREMSSTGGLKNTFNLGAVGMLASLAIDDSDRFFLAYTGENRPGDEGRGIFGRRGELI